MLPRKSRLRVKSTMLNIRGMCSSHISLMVSSYRYTLKCSRKIWLAVSICKSGFSLIKSVRLFLFPFIVFPVRCLSSIKPAYHIKEILPRIWLQSMKPAYRIEDILPRIWLQSLKLEDFLDRIFETWCSGRTCYQKICWQVEHYERLFCDHYVSLLHVLFLVSH
jgi:hypothetical protein